MRREYLYRKSLEGKEKELYDRKRRIQKALSEGKEIPTELRDEAKALQDDAANDDAETSQWRDHKDDEYAQAGVRDPKICVTTCATSRQAAWCRARGHAIWLPCAGSTATC